MLSNRKRSYALANFTVECRPSGWYFRNTYSDESFKGPYSSEISVCLMIARKLKVEILRRDRLPE